MTFYSRNYVNSNNREYCNLGVIIKIKHSKKGITPNKYIINTHFEGNKSSSNIPINFFSVDFIQMIISPT